jgi:hypothetical protein
VVGRRSESTRILENPSFRAQWIGGNVRGSDSKLGKSQKVRLSDRFDIPEEVSRGPHSPAFGKFLFSWFGDTGPLTHGELDIRFLNDLTPEELTRARQ